MKLQKIPSQRINGKLTPLNLAKVDSIVLHHMAHPSADVKTVEGWHVNGNGWTAIGYNFWVAFDGTVYKGRGFNVGAGVVNHNSHIINIGFQGDYSNPVEMPNAQFDAGVQIIKYVLEKLGRSVAIKGHRDFGGSVCPGTHFPMVELQTLKLRQEGEGQMIYNYIDNNMPEWARPYVQKAVDTGILKGNEHGELQLTDDKIWTLVVILRATGVMK